MAIVSLMFGSFLGVLCGMVSWIFLDTSALNALGLYFSVSLVAGLLPLVFAGLRGSDMRGASPEIARF